MCQTSFRHFGHFFNCYLLVLWLPIFCKALLRWNLSLLTKSLTSSQASQWDCFLLTVMEAGGSPVTIRNILPCIGLRLQCFYNCQWCNIKTISLWVRQTFEKGMSPYETAKGQVVAFAKSLIQVIKVCFLFQWLRLLRASIRATISVKSALVCKAFRKSARIDLAVTCSNIAPNNGFCI